MGSKVIVDVVAMRTLFSSGRIRTPVIQLVASPTILSEVLVLYLVCWQDLHYYRRLKNWSFSRMVIRLTVQLYIIFLALQPPVGQGLLIHEVSRSHTTTHYSR